MIAPRTYGAVKLFHHPEQHWQISELEPHVAIRLKHLFPKIPKAQRESFILRRDNPTDMDLQWFMQRYPLRISDYDEQLLQSGQRAFLALQAEMEGILIPAYDAPNYTGLRAGQAIRGYQAQAIEIAARSKGLLLGDECGLGKTFTGAGFCLEPSRLPAAIVCQVHIQQQWLQVITRFTTLRAVAVLRTRPYDLPPADIYIFRYSQLAGWVDIFEKLMLQTVIFDEPQELRRGRSSDRGVAAYELSQLVKYRMGLTATPIYNYGVEIYNVMQYINPDVLGQFDDFYREFVGNNGRLKNPKALGAFLREQYCFLRRSKADVGKEMPAVNRIIDIIEYDNDAMRSVDDTARKLAIKSTTGAFIERGNAARELDLLVRQATGIAKARHVANVVRVLVEGGEPVLLMGWHRDVYDIWLKELKDLKPLMYTGSETGRQKENTKNAFLAGKSDIIIMSLRSAAGLDGLQARCSTIVFGELDWSPGIHHQCIERLDREGQTKPVMALFLVAEDGSDPPMMEILGLKASEASQVIDPSAGVQAVHSDKTHLQMLADRYLDRKDRLRAQKEREQHPESQLEMEGSDAT